MTPAARDLCPYLIRTQEDGTIYMPTLQEAIQAARTEQAISKPPGMMRASRPVMVFYIKANGEEGPVGSLDIFGRWKLRA